VETTREKVKRKQTSGRMRRATIVGKAAVPSTHRGLVFILARRGSVSLIELIRVAEFQVFVITRIRKRVGARARQRTAGCGQLSLLQLEVRKRLRLRRREIAHFFFKSRPRACVCVGGVSARFVCVLRCLL
jgi:hypothetical protein